MGHPGTQPRAPAIPQAWRLLTAPPQVCPAPESPRSTTALCVLQLDGHLVPVPGRATALCAHFDVPLLSLARGRSFGGLREALPGFGDAAQAGAAHSPANPSGQSLGIHAGVSLCFWRDQRPRRPPDACSLLCHLRGQPVVPSERARVILGVIPGVIRRLIRG